MNEKKESLQTRKKQSNGHVQELTHNLEEKQAEKKSTSQTIDEQRVSFSSLEQQVQTIQKEISIAKKELDSTQQEFAEIKARQRILSRLREEREGFSAGSKRLLEESTNPKSPLYNIVRELHEFLIPQPGSENALATVLKQYAQTLVVETYDQLKCVLDYTKQHNIKDFSVVCIQILDTPPLAQKESLLHHVTDHPLARHFLSKINSANDLCTLASTPFYTKDGFYYDSQKVIFYAPPGEHNVFLREAELKKIEKTSATLDAKCKKTEELLNQLGRKKEGLEAEKSALDKSIRREEMRLAEIQFGLDRILKDIEKCQSDEKHIQNDLQVLQGQFEKIVQSVTELTRQHSATHAKGIELQKQCDKINEQLDSQARTLDGERLSLQERENAYRKASEEQKKIQHTLEIFEIQDKESQEQESRIAEEVRINKEQQTQAKEKEKAFENDLKVIDAALTEAQNSCRTQEQEISQRKQSVHQLESQLQESRIQMTKLEEELQRINLQKEQLTASSQNVTNNLQERFQLQIEDARTLVHEMTSSSVDQLEKQLRSLRQSVESATDINMTSIEECEKHKTRHTFLKQQMEDLNTSKAELIKVITELDTESRKLFQDTFAIIRENFKKNFTILFEGGEADLQFTEAADVLEAGIDIIAKPPGKQMRSISLLSGGEKCLTALALLFAIFEVKPAPFCILDEIDAPLDDTNVGRFLNVVKQFIDRCQFIIITHNKRTMSIADVLFGVSMEERGVSKLLTLEFAAAERELQTADEH